MPHQPGEGEILKAVLPSMSCPVTGGEDVSGTVARRRRWILASILGAALVFGRVVRMRAGRGSIQPDAPADVGFMRALHAALRRDLSRLREAAAKLGSSGGAPPTVLAGWDAFRAQLGN